LGGRPKAPVLCDEVYVLDPDLARRIVERVLGKAPEWTNGQLRARLRRLVLAADTLTHTHPTTHDSPCGVAIAGDACS
jgi:hypothetical protein